MRFKCKMLQSFAYCVGAEMHIKGVTVYVVLKTLPLGVNPVAVNI
jgi:hypothetical protein